MATPRKRPSKALSSREGPRSQRSGSKRSGAQRSSVVQSKFSFEFDAPMHRDFTQQTPENAPADAWFDARAESPSIGNTAGAFTPVRGVTLEFPSAERASFGASDIRPAYSPLSSPEAKFMDRLEDKESDLPPVGRVSGPVLRKRKQEPTLPRFSSKLPPTLKKEDEEASKLAFKSRIQRTPAHALKKTPAPPKASVPKISQPPPTARQPREPQPKSWSNTLTTPQEFTFMARDPKKPKAESEQFVSARTRFNAYASQLRPPVNPLPFQRPGVTRPVEFSFATRARTRSMTEALRAALPPPPARVPSQAAISRSTTQPKSFNFATAARKRTLTQPPENPRPAKATLPRPNPVRKPNPVPPPARKTLTVPHEFKLSKPARLTNPVPPEPGPTSRFKARPFNKSAFEQPVLRTSTKRLTVPRTPVVARRSKAVPVKPPVEEEKVSFKARQAPAVPAFCPETSKKPLTVPAPFDLRTEVRGADKEERLKQHVEEEKQREAEARVFVHRSPPNLESAQVPTVEHPPLTVFEPFNLLSESLSAIAKQKQQERIRHEQALEEEMRRFKALPAVTLTRKPFQACPSNRPLTLPETPNLKSTVRAQDRADFSLEKNQRISQKEQRTATEKALQEEREKQEVKKLRQTLVIPATPAPNPPPMRVAPSTRPLTLPLTPKLGLLRQMR